jgi:hypothetical protein
MYFWDVTDSKGTTHRVKANVLLLEEGYIIFKQSSTGKPTHMFYHPISVKEV